MTREKSASIVADLGDSDEEDTTDIILGTGKSNHLEVKGGTLVKLVERLTHHKSVGSFDFVLFFYLILRYRLFERIFVDISLFYNWIASVQTS